MTLSARFLFASFLILGGALSSVACSAPDIPPGPPLVSSSKDKPKTSPPKKTPEPTQTPAGPSAPPPPAAPQADQPPTITSVSPAAIAVGSSPGGLEVTLTGTHFAAGAQVDVAGTKIPATFDSATELKVKIPADKLNAAGMLRLAVEVKPGQQSNAISFTVANPTNVTISDLNPKSTTLGANQSITLNITGSGFTSSSVVKFNGAQLQTTFSSATSLSASIPASTFIDAGRFSVTVSTGTDVVSLPVSFEVQNPLPASSTIAPTSITAGSAAVAVTINGTGFSKGSEVLSGTTALATTFISATQLRATVPSNLLTSSGTTLKLVVQTGAPGGGLSNAQSLSVTAAATTTGGTTGSTTTTKPDCAYLCSDYGYAPGQCYQDYYCITSGTYAGCLGQTTCGDTTTGGTTTGGDTGAGGTGTTSGGFDTSSCEYDCKTYNYAPGECYQDYYCSIATGCLISAICE